MSTAVSIREQREAVVNAHIVAENAGNIDATIATFHHPRYNVVPMGAISDGEAAVRELIGGLVHSFPDFHVETRRLHHADEAVIIEAVITGTQKADWAGIATQGKRMEVPIVCVFDFENAKLVNESVYFDFATLERQLK